MSPGRTLFAAILVASLAGGWGCSRQASPAQVQAWNAEIKALEAQQDSLRRRAAELVANDSRIQKLPKGDVVLSVPTAFLRNVIERVFDDVVSNTTLSLSGIKVHVAKSIKKVVTIGEFVVDVDIQEVIGKLRPGQPTIVFGNNAVAMSLPVEVNAGTGKAKIHFVWNGKNVADAACGDMDITQTVTGNVIPSKYLVTGRMNLQIHGNKVICAPVFPETRVQIRVRPSKQSWAAIDSILATKTGLCGWIIEKVNVPNLLTGIVEEKGFSVKLPINKIKPFALPGGVSDTLTVGGRTISISSQMNEIRIDPDAVWYGASVTLR